MAFQSCAVCTDPKRDKCTISTLHHMTFRACNIVFLSYVCSHISSLPRCCSPFPKRLYCISSNQSFLLRTPLILVVSTSPATLTTMTIRSHSRPTPDQESGDTTARDQAYDFLWSGPRLVSEHCVMMHSCPQSFLHCPPPSFSSYPPLPPSLELHDKGILIGDSESGIPKAFFGSSSSRFSQAIGLQGEHDLDSVSRKIQSHRVAATGPFASGFPYAEIYQDALQLQKIFVYLYSLGRCEIRKLDQTRKDLSLQEHKALKGRLAKLTSLMDCTVRVNNVAYVLELVEEFEAGSIKRFVLSLRHVETWELFTRRVAECQLIAPRGSGL